jgi:hypothetical protein
MNLMNLRKAIMDEDNITLEEMQQIFNVTKEELFESIKELLKDSDNDTKLKERLEQRKDIIYGKIHINRDCRGIVNFGDTKYHINTEDVYDALNNDISTEDEPFARVILPKGSDGSISTSKNRLIRIGD